MSKKIGMDEVRRELWQAYQRAQEFGVEVDEKTSEGHCALYYPTIYDAQSEEEFCEPEAVMIYSYALGPAKKHFIRRGPIDRKSEYTYTWESPDIFRKAIEIIKSWVAEMEKNVLDRD